MPFYFEIMLPPHLNAKAPKALIPGNGVIFTLYQDMIP